METPNTALSFLEKESAEKERNRISFCSGCERAIYKMDALRQGGKTVCVECYVD